MEAKEKVKIKSLEPYRHLFPKALVIDKTVKKGASVKDTVHVIPLIVKKTAWQVQKYVDHELKGLNTYDACKKLWQFVKYHIEYRPDERGIEQVRSPRRLIHDGYGDCDCGTTFILTCLYVLKIPATRRITKYEENRFQHIYPVVPLRNGKEIIVDFVVHQFNYEEPYTEKEDYKMDLQFLDGIEDRDPTLLGVDAQDLYGGLNDIGELGQLLRKARNRGGGIFKKKTPEQKKQKKAERKKKLFNFVHKANRINAGAALLRAGVLASMKLNLLKVAEKLKWGYATREQAQKYGMDMSKYDKLKQILTKAEKVFYAAGGKPENLKKAMLTGRGNRRHEFAGLDGYSESTPINELLGAIYEDEFVNGLEGEGLGIATEAAIASATGAMAALAALLKQVGVLFPKKDGEGKKSRRRNSDDSESGGDGGGDNGGGGGSDASENSESESTESNGSAEQSEESSQSENESQDNSDASEDESSNDNLPATMDDQTPTTTSDEDSEDKPESSDDENTNGLNGLGGIKDFYQKNKKWIVPVGIAATAITLGLVINHYASKPAPKTQPQPVQQSTTVNGTPRKRKRRKTGEKDSGKQSVIALM
jgi:hypothetical protein